MQPQGRDGGKAYAQIRRFIPAGGLSAILPEPGTWQPVPAYADRAAWTGVREAAREWALARAAALRGTAWPQLLAHHYGRFRVDGNRRAYEGLYFGRRSRIVTHVLAALVGGADADLQEVIDGLWLVCEESSWCIPAHERNALAEDVGLPDPRRPFIDLFAADTAGMIAWTQVVLGDDLAAASPPLARRLPDEVRRRILDPFRTRHWHWQGGDGLPAPNNWNPWIHSNILSAALVFERDHADLYETVNRTVSGLDHFLDGYPADGGCDEGVGYWWKAGASLFDCLEILRDATGGRFDAFDIPVLRGIARYPLVAHIAGTWKVNFGDGSALGTQGENVHALYRFGQRLGDEDIVRHARSERIPLDDASAPNMSPMRLFPALLDGGWASTEEPAEPYLSAAEYLPDTGVLTAREHPGSTDGLYLAAKGGHNGESHNHNDVGTFTLAFDGRPLLIDIGVGEYTRKTFSPQRYEIWTMRSTYHNLPEINGVEQAPGREHRAGAATAAIDDSRAGYGLDLAAAYPQEAGVEHWRRTSTLHRGHGSESHGRIVITDEWSLRPSANTLSWSLMTADPVDISVPGRLAWPERGFVVDYDPGGTEADVEEIPIDDIRLTPVWGKRVWRIRLTSEHAPSRGTFTLTMHAADSAG